MRYTWNEDGTLTVDQVTFSGDLQETVHQALTLPGEEWLQVAVTILDMLPGKPSSDGRSFLLAPAGADPGMIGELVAAMLRNSRPAI